MQKWTLPTISEIITKSRADEIGCHTPELETEVIRHPSPASKRLKVVKEWSGAIAALEQLLLDSLSSPLSNSSGFKGDRGIVLAGPAPILSQKQLLASFQTGVFTAEWLKLSGGRPFQLPPAVAKSDVAKSDPLPVAVEIDPPGSTTIPLLPGDPLAGEQFCLVLTDSFSLVMVSGTDCDRNPVFMFAFEPEIVAQAWRTLRARVALTSPRYLLLQLDAIANKYAPVAPDYRIVAQFSRLLLKYLPESEEGQGDKKRVGEQRRLGAEETRSRGAEGE